ncbi:telomerase reverse transcriptase-like [Centruroides sculpturatus]|uniref:telomerase reverse transcriptase-like n=1 Tax=Centruroides sculpturatus TaxID=218467 RepID=UPI000C6CF6A7|nr:telomerase reverse transcriptase-like [Centruroides sculpturatus]
MDNEWMTVLDYKALYPSIKLPPCFCALRDFLLAKISNSMKYHMQILELADLICHTSFFQFEDKTYLQARGVPMGSPMSAILCELVLRKLENDILPSFQEDILAYARYVDDIFILWKDNRMVNQFIDLINDNPYGLTLELEQESGNNVNFLDLSITCKDGEIRTDIYWKPTYLPIVIPSQTLSI